MLVESQKKMEVKKNTKKIHFTHQSLQKRRETYCSLPSDPCLRQILSLPLDCQIHYLCMTMNQACQQYISIAIYLFIAINIFIIALFSILQYIIAAKKLQYYCNILQKYVSIRVYMYIVGLTRD